jgi:ferritin-like metal-binding protein YciE
MNSLKILFLHALADRYDAEKRLVRALPKMGRQATCKKLKTLVQSRVQEGAAHLKKIEFVFGAFGARVKAKKCEATAGLIQEGDDLAAFFRGSPAINAALISTAQKTDHYAIACFGSLYDWARLLENHDASTLLHTMLAETKAANHEITRLAECHSNTEALGTSDLNETRREVKPPIFSNRRIGGRPRTFNRIHPVLMCVSRRIGLRRAGPAKN